MPPKVVPHLTASHTSKPASAKRGTQEAITAALAGYQTAQATLPHNAATQVNIGNALVVMGKMEEAEAAYRRAIALAPSSVAAMCKLAELLATSERTEEAIASYEVALLLDPCDLSTRNVLGTVLQAAGRFDEAIEAYRGILALDPESAVAHSNIGSALQGQGHIDLAIQEYQRALEISPHFISAHFNLGTSLLLLGKLDESLVYFSNTVKYDPHYYVAHNNLSATLSKLGRTEETVEACRRAIQINPEWNDMHSNLLFALTHSEVANPADIFEEHLGFGRQFETPWLSQWPQHDNERNPERVLRIGFVSADLNNHAMANFITPVLENLIHATSLEIFIYSNNKVDDHITSHLRAVVGRWKQIQALTDDELAQQIVKDGIDILIDLSGHTGYNRLLTFARKPAPLQATWMGYPMTTGMRAIDYFLTDRYYSPAGLLDEQFTEKLLRLPAAAPYVPSPAAPAIEPAPSLEHGYITFGSFNRANKLNRSVIACWSALLRAVPQAKILLAGMPSEQMIDMLRGWFDEEEIAADRLSFHAITNIRDYLALHRHVDVCLDTWPYTGGTTTLNALWMGVPTLTMVGQTLPSRVGATILSHQELDQFIAHDEADFLQKGVSIAADLSALANMRMGMRARISNSAAGQPALIAAGVESALRTMWQRWCAGLPTESFDADPSQSSLAKRAASMKALHAVNVDAALLLAIEHHQAGRLVEAETLYLAIIHSQPRHAIANHNMGLLADQIGYFNKALPYLRAAILTTPDEGQFILSYGQALLHAGQADAAVEVLADAIERNLQTGDTQALLSRAQSAAAGEVLEPTQAEADQIVALYQAGRHAEMENAAHRLVICYPASGFAWGAYGTALQLEGKDAVATLQRAVQLAPDDAQANVNLGNAWQDAGEHASAIACYQRALELDPAFAEACGNMGSAQHAMGSSADAADSFRRAVLIDPAYALAHANLGSVLAQLGELQEATTSYRAALALAPDDVQLQRDLADVLRSLGRDEEAAATDGQAELPTGAEPPKH